MSVKAGQAQTATGVNPEAAEAVASQCSRMGVRVRYKAGAEELERGHRWSIVEQCPGYLAAVVAPQLDELEVG